MTLIIQAPYFSNSIRNRNLDASLLCKWDRLDEAKSGVCRSHLQCRFVIVNESLLKRFFLENTTNRWLQDICNVVFGVIRLE